MMQPIETPIYSEITSGLWMGGTDEFEMVNRAKPLPTFNDPIQFDSVVTLSAYSQPFGWHVKEFRYCIPDAPLTSEHVIELEGLAEWAFLQWKSGKETLIRCQAGMNRSGLVTAMVLMRNGSTAESAIKLIRKKRHPDALGNGSYVAYLMSRSSSHP
jgi:hypothetical protein